MDAKKVLFELASADYLGGAGEVKEIIKREAAKYATVTELRDGTVVAEIKGKTDRVIMLDAHYDQIGFIVTEVFEGGFLKVSAVGGMDKRILPSTRVKIYGKKVITGVFTSVPPHLKKDEKVAGDITEIFVDTGYTEGVEKIVSVGDMGTFATEPCELSEGVVTGKALDDRAGCLSLLIALENIKNEGVPPMTVKAAFVDKEELRMLGAVTAAYNIEPDEAIAVDVSFGDTPGISPTDTGVVGRGAMIGLSPVLSKDMQNEIIRAAENSADYQYEVMGGKTGTDIDVIVTSKGGVRGGLISIPLRNMHTNAETVYLSDIKAVGDIISEYVMGKEVK